MRLGGGSVVRDVASPPWATLNFGTVAAVLVLKRSVPEMYIPTQRIYRVGRRTTSCPQPTLESSSTTKLWIREGIDVVHRPSLVYS